MKKIGQWIKTQKNNYNLNGPEFSKGILNKPET
jgi:hypothetical protein